jgi:hypothetical protein
MTTEGSKGTMRRILRRPEGPWTTAVVVGVALLLASVFLPLWQMNLKAPQYPKGLLMYAYGYKFADNPRTTYNDINEISNLNHYIGMKPIKKVAEMNVFLPGVAALALLALASTVVGWRKRLVRLVVVGGFWFAVLFFLADLQYWLYHYGHDLDPHAPIRTSPFTPKLVGALKVWNFTVETRFAPGFYLLLGAALAITILPPALATLKTWVGQRLGGRALTGVPQ